ncbi:MAG: DUF4159 domain-containing protein [Candidatus Latescibacterota bacterium]
MFNKRIHFRRSRRFCLAGIAALVLITMTDAAPERTNAVLDLPDEIFIISRPETIPAKDMVRKRFRPVVPKRTAISARRPEMRLYTGIAEANVPEFISEPFPKTPVISIGDPQIPMTGPMPGDYIPPRYIPRAFLREEMLDFEDLDNGRYRALAARIGRDEQDIRGFVYIPTVWGQQLSVPDRLKRSVMHLAEGVNQYTDIKAKPDTHLFLSSGKVFETPFLYVTTDHAFELTSAEREILGRYLRNGGFVFADNGAPQYENGAAETSLRKMFRDALGCHARFEPIPASHPLYHCFFDFDGPPQAAELTMTSTYTVGSCGGIAGRTFLPRPILYLEGIFLEGRLVAIYSDKGYGEKWGQSFQQWYGGRNNDPQIKFGVNLVVYALTRKGGITERNMRHFDVQ